MTHDRLAVDELIAVSSPQDAHPVIHYVYSPEEFSASSVASKLPSSGFDTEERPSVDGANWLVLARHVIVPTEELMMAIRRAMEALVAKFGGEYDGWEADVRIHQSNSSIRQ